MALNYPLWKKIRIVALFLIVTLTLCSLIVNFTSRLPRLENWTKSNVETNYGYIDLTTYESEFKDSLVLTSLDLGNASSVIYTPRNGINGDLVLVTLDEQLVEKRRDKLGTGYLFVFDILAIDGELYLSTVRKSTEECLVFEVSKTRDKSSLDVVWSGGGGCLQTTNVSPIWTHYQGKLAKGLDGEILLTTGFFLTDVVAGTLNPALKLPTSTPIESLDATYPIFGKVFGINIATHEYRILGKGLRGPSGIAALEKSVLVLDQGPRGGDELNIIDRSTLNEEIPDFGWPVVSYGLPYQTQSKTNGPYLPRRLPDLRDRQIFYGPSFIWSPSIAPQGAVDADSFPRPKLGKEQVIIGTLKHRSLIILDLIDSTVVAEESVKIGKRIRDLDVMDGKLILSTDTGEIIKATWSQKKLPNGQFPPITETGTSQYFFDVAVEMLSNLTRFLFE